MQYILKKLASETDENEAFHINIKPRKPYTNITKPLKLKPHSNLLTNIGT